MRNASLIVPGTFCGGEIEPGVFHSQFRKRADKPTAPTPPTESAGPRPNSSTTPSCASPR